MDFSILAKNRWLVVLGVIGILCLVGGTLWQTNRPSSVSTLATTTSTGVSQGSGNNGSTPSGSPMVSSTISSNTVNAITAIENADQSQMEAMLSKLSGVNSVSVMVSVNASNQITLANSIRTTTDSTVNGKEKHQSTTTDKQPFTSTVSGNTQPVVIQSTSPEVSGVLVLVNAKDFYVAKAEIIDAITNVWDVPAYNISVEPEK